MIVLGQQVRCRVTGFRGIVIGRSEYLFANPTILVQPTELDEGGYPKKSEWYDESKFEVFGDPLIVGLENCSEFA